MAVNYIVLKGIWMFLLLVSLERGPLSAAEIDGVTFPDSYRMGSTTMSLNGTGLAKFLYTIKVYAGALYLGAGATGETVLTDVPKRLELAYLRSVEAKDIIRASEKNLADNVPQSTIGALRSRIDRMHRLYENVGAGDRYALTYLPGVGTELTLNGQRKGVIEGADFAAAYFAIWLGPDPINQPLKDGLLNHH
jgi:Chalcone isomerase-like